MVWVHLTLGKCGGVRLLGVFKRVFIYEGILGFGVEVFMESLVIGYLALS